MTTSTKVEFAAVSVLTAARDVFTEFLRHPKLGAILAEKEKTGLYVCVGERGYGVYTTTLIGSHPTEKPATFDMALAKARFLLDNPSCRMSREGRNPPLMYGGGLALPDRLNPPGKELILTGSALPEHIDELFVMAWGARLKMLDRPQVISLLTEFPNDYAKPEESNLVFL